MNLVWTAVAMIISGMQASTTSVSCGAQGQGCLPGLSGPAGQCMPTVHQSLSKTSQRELAIARQCKARVWAQPVQTAGPAAQLPTFQPLMKAMTRPPPKVTRFCGGRAGC